MLIREFAFLRHRDILPQFEEVPIFSTTPIAIQTNLREFLLELRVHLNRVFVAEVYLFYERQLPLYRQRTGNGRFC